MFRKFQDVVVELNTPQGVVFSGSASSVELRMSDAVVALGPMEETHFNLTEDSQITVRCGSEFHHFALRNTTAGFRNGKLTLLAESIRPSDGVHTERSDPSI